MLGISFSLHTILFFLLAQAKLASAVGTRNGSSLTNGRITSKVVCTGKELFKKGCNTKADPSGTRSAVQYIGGLVSELNELVALILASDKDFENLYEEGVSMAFVHDSEASSARNHELNRSINNVEGHYAAKKPSKNKSFFQKTRQQC